MRLNKYSYETWEMIYTNSLDIAMDKYGLDGIDIEKFESTLEQYSSETKQEIYYEKFSAEYKKILDKAKSDFEKQFNLKIEWN